MNWHYPSTHFLTPNTTPTHHVIPPNCSDIALKPVFNKRVDCHINKKIVCEIAIGEPHTLDRRACSYDELLINLFENIIFIILRIHLILRNDDWCGTVKR